MSSNVGESSRASEEARDIGEDEADANRHLAGWCEGFEHVEECQARQGSCSNTADETDHDCRLEIRDEQMQQRDQNEYSQAQLGEIPESKLVADLYQRNRKADIRRHIGGDQPCCFRIRGTQITLNLRDVRRNQVHAETLRHRQ
jgi:hypothetical protein